jgi:hypothetical protein
MELILLSAIGTTALFASEFWTLVLRGTRRTTHPERRRPIAATVFLAQPLPRSCATSRFL